MRHLDFWLIVILLGTTPLIFSTWPGNDLVFIIWMIIFWAVITYRGNRIRFETMQFVRREMEEESILQGISNN